MPEIEYKSPSEAKIAEHAKIYSTEEEKNAFLSHYDPQKANADSNTHEYADNYITGYSSYYFQGFTDARNGAEQNSGLADVNTIAADMAGMDSETRAIAYTMGYNYGSKKAAVAPRAKPVVTTRSGLSRKLSSGWSNVSRSDRAVLNILGKAFKVTVVIDEATKANENQNGHYENGVIHVTEKDSGVMLKAFAHEITHHSEIMSAEEHKAYKDYVVDYLRKKDGLGLEERIESLISRYREAGVELDYDGALNEIVANATEGFLTDPDFINELVSENRTLAQKIIDIFDSIIEYISKAIKDYTSRRKRTPFEIEKLNEDKIALQEAKSLWLAAMKKSAEATAEQRRSAQAAAATENSNEQAQKNTDTESSGEVKYSVKENPESQIDEVLNNTFDKNNHVYLGKTPQKLVDILGLPQLPMLMTANHVYSCVVSKQRAIAEGRYSKNVHYHDLGKETLASIPKEMGRPLMLIKSNNDNTDCDFVVVTNKLDKDSRPVIVAVKINGKGYRMSIEFDANIALSVYGRNDFVGYLKRAYDEKRILYINKKSQHLNIPGVQFPNNILNADYINSLTQFKRIVNSSIYKNSENDSKVTLTKSNGKVVRFSLSEPEPSEKYTYDIMISKPDMFVPDVGDIDLSLNSDGKISRKDVVVQSLKNIRKKNNPQNKGNKVFLYNKDLKRDVKITADSIEHGLARKLENNAVASLALSEYFSEAICVNELEPREKNNKSYVLLGTFSTDVARYYVRMVVNEKSNVYEMEDVNVLYAINTKKESDARERRGLGVKTDNPSPDSTISIADFLEDVKRFHGDVLSEDVYDHFNEQRPKTNLNGLLFSLTEPEEITLEEALEENSRLKEIVRNLEMQTELTNHMLNDKDIDKIARKLIRETSSKIDLETLKSKLKTAYDYIAKGKEVDGAEVNRAFVSIAREVIDKSEQLEPTDEVYEAVKHDLRNTQIFVGDELINELNSVDGYNTIRKKNYGRLKMNKGRTNVDRVYSGLSAEYPSLFPNDIINPADQLLTIDAVAELVNQKNYVNPHDMYYDEAVQDLALQMFDEYFNVREVKTFADKKQAEFTRLKIDTHKKISQLREYYKTSRDEAVKEVRNEKNEKLKQVRADRDEKLSNLRSEKNEKISQLREEKNERIAAEVRRRVDMRKELVAKHNESNNVKKYRRRINKTVKELQTMLLHPTDKKHVPEGLRKALADILAGLDFTSSGLNKEGEETQKTIKWLDIQKKIREISEKEDNILEFDPEISNKLDALDDAAKGKKIDRYNADELKTLSEVLTAIKTAINNQNKTLSDAKSAEIDELVSDLRSDLKIYKSKEVRLKATETFRKLLKADMLDSFTYFKQLGKTGEWISTKLSNALDKRTRHIAEAEAYSKEVLDGVDTKHITGKDAKIHKFTINGVEVKLTTAQIMSLYELAKREQGLHHLLTGGIKRTAIEENSIN